jgi:hypothetical protein
MANKTPPDFPHLLVAPGANVLTLDTLHRICVQQQGTDRRKQLWSGFAALYKRFLDAGLFGLDLWVNGSFMTVVPTPQHVDCVLWVPQSHIDHCTDSQYNELWQLRDEAAIKSKYGVKLCVQPPDSPNNDFWTSHFSTARDGITLKGFARLAL